jgi:hypothetical protein
MARNSDERSDSMDATQSESLIECPRRRPRFRSITPLLALLLLMAIVLGGVCITVIKLQQDRTRTAAFHQLREMGFQTSIHAGPRKATSVAFVATEPPPSLGDLQKLPQLLVEWTRAHDLGFSPARNIDLLDLRGTGVSEDVITELRQRFPAAEIQH